MQDEMVSRLVNGSMSSGRRMLVLINSLLDLAARKAGAATGSGLGLAFCKLAVEAQNGRIWLEPFAEGTTVCFTLPLISATNKTE